MAAVLAALTVLQFWWTFYQTGQAQVWRLYGQFLPLLALVVVLVLLAAAALPDEVRLMGSIWPLTTRRTHATSGRSSHCSSCSRPS
jgi:hypothetical protein